MRPRRIRSLPAVLLLALAACGGTAATAPPASGPAPVPSTAAGPAEAVERFLTLAASHSYLQMGQLFGTVAGPITNRDPGPQVERRMYTISNIVRNDRFVIRGQQAIPGRGPEAQQLTVAITQGGEVKDVPFVVVRTAGGNWLVEQIDLQALTRTQ